MYDHAISRVDTKYDLSCGNLIFTIAGKFCIYDNDKRERYLVDQDEDYSREDLLWSVQVNSSLYVYN